MGLEHNPDKVSEQISWRHCFQKWLQSPAGERIRVAVRQEMRHYCHLSYADRIVQLAPMPLLPDIEREGAWWIHLASSQAQVLADYAFLPLQSERFSCVILAYCALYAEDMEQVMMEVARILAPEGYVFLLEVPSCVSWQQIRRERLGLVKATHTVLPAGLRRGIQRRWVRHAGLQLRRQRNMSIMPAMFPADWQGAMSSADRWLAPWLVPLGSCVLTIAQRRDVIPLFDRRRWGWSGAPLQAPRGSQWAKIRGESQ